MCPSHLLITQGLGPSVTDVKMAEDPKTRVMYITLGLMPSVFHLWSCLAAFASTVCAGCCVLLGEIQEVHCYCQVCYTLVKHNMFACDNSIFKSSTLL